MLLRALLAEIITYLKANYHLLTALLTKKTTDIQIYIWNHLHNHIQYSSKSCVTELLLQHRPDIFLVAVRHNWIIQRILPCLLIEFWIHITVVSPKNRAKEVVGVIEGINKGDRIRTDLRIHESNLVIRRQVFFGMIKLIVRENCLGQTWEYRDLSWSFASEACLGEIQPVLRKSPRCLWRRNKAYTLPRISNCSFTPFPGMSCFSFSMNLKWKIEKNRIKILLQL